MPYIDLTERGQPLGRAELPIAIVGDRGHRFGVGRIVQNPAGGNGVVLEGHNLPGGAVCEKSPCAIKFLRNVESMRRDRFLNEARIMKEVHGPLIAGYFDQGEEEVCAVRDGNGTELRVPWIAMELGGVNLRRHIQDQGPLALPSLRKVGLQMCQALHAVHDKAIIHRDVKPDNFVWDKHGNDSIKMIDCGIAKFIGEDTSGRPMDEFTRTTEFVGPQFYSSPELIAYGRDKSEPVDHRSDIFQAGKVLWFLATGKISAGIPSRKNCPAGSALWEIVCHMLDDDPEARPASMLDVAAALSEI